MGFPHKDVLKSIELYQLLKKLAIMKKFYFHSAYFYQLIFQNKPKNLELFL